MLTGLIFNIQRFSVHDGPGIRTTVFFKGCPLHCFWCHNPEGIHPQPEIQFYPERCIGCGACLGSCPVGAHMLQGDERLFDRRQCRACGACAETCYAGALELVGREMTVDQVMGEVLRDHAFYGETGGVTLSGGEPLLQPQFSRALLHRCREAGIHTALETAANGRWNDLAALLPFTDLVMMDIKHIDEEAHRAATGVSNARILENARRLAQTDVALLFRVPVVPTVNDAPADIRAIAAFVRELSDLRQKAHPEAGGLSLHLLAFHRLAGDKYRGLGMEYEACELESPSDEKMAALRAQVQALGVLAEEG